MTLEQVDQLNRDRHLPPLPTLGVEAQVRLRGPTHSLQFKTDVAPEQVHNFQFAQTREQSEITLSTARQAPKILPPLRGRSPLNTVER